jgi:hypothetical protein
MRLLAFRGTTLGQIGRRLGAGGGPTPWTGFVKRGPSPAFFGVFYLPMSCQGCKMRKGASGDMPAVHSGFRRSGGRWVPRPLGIGLLRQ